MSSAAEQWLTDEVDVVEIDGEVVLATVTVDLDIDSVVTLRRTAVTTDRPQGLVLDADEPLRINDARATRFVLWTDTAPDEVRIEAPAGRLTVWNVWNEDGSVHAWIGAAGIRRKPMDAGDHDAAARFVASDGHPPLRADLEFELLIDAAG